MLNLGKYPGRSSECFLGRLLIWGSALLEPRLMGAAKGPNRSATGSKHHSLPLFRENPVVSQVSRPSMLSEANKHNLQFHLMTYLLVTLAISLLLLEQSQLASRANAQSTSLADILVQQGVLAVLLGLMLVTYGWTKIRWQYVLSAILFAGYSGTRLASAFSQTLGLVPALQNMDVPISDYQGTFYLLALASAICYLLTILLLRRSYGRLSLKDRTHEMV